MKPAALLLLTVFVLSLGTASAGGAFEWKEPQYFDAILSELRLSTTQPGYTTDCDWEGPEDGTLAIIHSKPDFSSWNCTPFYLWSTVCTGAAQTVVFEKRVYLPGPAQDLDVSLLSYGKAIDMEILINGFVALKSRTDVHKRDLKDKAKLFRLGMNTFTVRARKGKTAEEKCNFARTEYGVLAQVHAKFASDIVVSDPTGACIPRIGTCVVQFTVKNNGPSHLEIVSASFSAYTPRLEVDDPATNKAMIMRSGAGAKDCRYGRASTYFRRREYDGYSVSCSLGRMAPGESAAVSVTYVYLAPEGEYSDWYPISLGATGDLRDPKPGNNGEIGLQSSCRPVRRPCPNPPR